MNNSIFLLADRSLITKKYRISRPTGIFIAEKEIDSRILEVQGDNGVNFIPVEVVIEHIMAAPDHEKEKNS